MFETVFVQKVSHFLLHCSSHLWCCYHLFAFYLLSIYFYDKYTVSILIWKIFIMICFGCVGFYLFLTLFFFKPLASFCLPIFPFLFSVIFVQLFAILNVVFSSPDYFQRAFETMSILWNIAIFWYLSYDTSQYLDS